MRDIARFVLVLGLIGVGAATSLAWVRTSLAPRIEQQEDFYVRGPALSRLFEQPADELLANKVIFETAEASFPVFFQVTDGDVSGLAVQASGQGGYGGDIVVMIGIDLAANQLIGVEVISHSETPGLGAKVELESFRSQWQGLAAGEAVALRTAGGGIDAISGATFSSSAMVDGTNRVVALLREHGDEIMARIAAKGDLGGTS